MKKTLLVSFFVFWVLTTSLVAGAFLKRDEKSADSPILGRPPELADTTNRLPASPEPTIGAIAEDPGLTVQAASLKILDANEVAGHNSASDCWMIIDNNVYNFTGYLGQHAGGAGTILPYCGKDGSQAYKTKNQTPARGHSDYAAGLFKNYYIGKLGAVVAPVVAKNSAAKAVRPAAASQAAVKPKTPKVVALLANNSSSPADDAQPINNQAEDGSGITSAAVATHNNAGDCWSIIGGSVYNLTSLASSHSGGAAAIIGSCGKDGTTLFNSHSHSAYAVNALDAYYIGELAPGAPALASVPRPVSVPVPAPAPIIIYLPQPAQTNQAITLAAVATHNSAADCWTIMNNKVYNITAYIPNHHGGGATIVPICGRDGAAAFSGKHSGSAGANNILASYYIGDLSTNTTTPPVVSAPPPPIVLPPPATSYNRYRPYSDDSDDDEEEYDD